MRWHFAADVRLRIAPGLVGNSVDACVQAACGGHGITRTYSCQVAHALADHRLVRVLPDHEPAAAPIHAVYQAGRLKSRTVRLVVDALTTALGGHAF